MLTAVAVVGMCLLLIQAPAHGAVTCSTTMSKTTDSDGDGFTDYQECYGLTAGDPASGASVTIPGRTNCGQTRASCLDPDSKDLFVTLVPASGSILTKPEYFGNNLMQTLEYVTNPIGQAAGQGGLGITAHVGNVPNRQVISKPKIQKAVKITESLDISDPITLGISNYGTPNKLDLATIFTQRIVNFVDSLCANVTSCADSTGVTSLDLKKKYIKHVIAHEVGHVVSLTNVSNPNFGGYHYQTGVNVVLDQSVYYTNKSGVVTYYIGTNYTANDQSVFKMK
jgi:hypothetical protein